jgi:2-polyprenyl-6-methoxyphenol hydroxylase-like FAD-dependent oxidoreductase
MPTAGNHAVIIGASVAGLLAASALSQSFGRVTVYDRDDLPVAAEPRKGVPQSRHAHGVLARGAEAMNELLPGFFDEMAGAGAVTIDAQLDFAWYLERYRLGPAESGLPMVLLTRQLLEWLIRARVESLPNVRIVDKSAVDGLDAAGGRVTGVLVRGESAAVAADLVVDASGRGSRAPVWLRELGYDAPEVSEVRADVTYLTRHYRRAPGVLGDLRGATVAPYPGVPRGGFVACQEGSQFAVVLVGMVGVEPPTDDEGMLAFASQFDGPEIASVIRECEPLDAPATMRYPASTWRHHEKMKRRPDRFVVTGDALCTFNPVYGQGMTVAALEALVLRDAVVSAGLSGLPERFYNAAAKLLGRSWALSVGGDLRFPEVDGKRQPGSGLINSYLDAYRRAASVDPVLAKAFLVVVNTVGSPVRLLAPAMMLRVLRSAGKAAPVERPELPAPVLSVSGQSHTWCDPEDRGTSRHAGVESHRR